jgi:hypothetical protein
MTTVDDLTNSIEDMNISDESDSDDDWVCYFCKRNNTELWSAFLKRKHQFCSGVCVIAYVQKRRYKKERKKMIQRFGKLRV